MLPAALKRRRALGRTAAWWAASLRWLALIVLIVATPIAQQVYGQVASVIVHATDDCAEECEEDDCCPAPCTTCHGCAHSSALAVVLPALPILCESDEFVNIVLADLDLSGYVPPPFRPPTA
jgi:hypothetical protein